MTKSVFNCVSAGAAITGAGIWLAGACGIAHADTAPDGSSSSPVSHLSSSPPKKRVSMVRAPATPAEATSGSALPAATAPTGLRTSKARVIVGSGPVHLPGGRLLGTTATTAPRGALVASATTPVADATPTPPSTVTAITPVAVVANPVVNLLAGVLSFFGLNTPHAPSNPIGALVWEVFRRVESVFGVVPEAVDTTVSAPTADGVVTGTVGIEGSAGLPLTYTATVDPTQGVVSVNPDGTFTFTPSQTARLAAGRPGAAGAATVVVTASNGLAATNTTLIVPVSPYEKGTVIATIPVGRFPKQAALSPDGRYLYVVKEGDEAVSVIDTATNTVVGAPIPVGGHPSSVAVATTSHGTYVYVTNAADGTVSVIDTATNTVVGVIRMGAFSSPIQVAVGPDGRYAYITGHTTTNNRAVTVIDLDANAIVAAVPVGRGATGVAVATKVPLDGIPPGRFSGPYAIVANSADNTVSMIFTITNTVVATIPVGQSPIEVAVSPDGRYAYVTNLGDSTVSVIDTLHSSDVATVAVGNSPQAVAVSPDGKFVYVNNVGDGTVSVIDTATNSTVGDPIAVGVAPFWIAVSNDGSLAYVPNYDENGTVSVIYTGNWATPESAA